jgi:hypothetical protein
MLNSIDEEKTFDKIQLLLHDKNFDEMKNPRIRSQHNKGYI